jgi:hypothetical protein
MAMSDSITVALAATTRSKAAARCTAISTYDPSASRQDAASGLPGLSFADSIGMPTFAQACAKTSRASRAVRSRSSARPFTDATVDVCPSSLTLTPPRVTGRRLTDEQCLDVSPHRSSSRAALDEGDPGRLEATQGVKEFVEQEIK